MWELHRLLHLQLLRQPYRRGSDGDGGDDGSGQLRLLDAQRLPGAQLQLDALQPQDAQRQLVFQRLQERDGGDDALALDEPQQQERDDDGGGDDDDGEELQCDDDHRDDDAVLKLNLCKWMPLLWERKYTFS